ncbi:hypothetical protein KBD49_05485, partial [Myxococcota bacterium]|nr:hypothetical protein [Myxococcota bacterium]
MTAAWWVLAVLLALGAGAWWVRSRKAAGDGGGTAGAADGWERMADEARKRAADPFRSPRE